MSTHSVTPIIRNTLVFASRREDGVLPAEGLTNKTRTRLLEAKWAEQPAGTTQLVITIAGRRAVLSHPQLSALTSAQSDDRLAPNAMWQTSRALGALRLVHFWDDKTQSFHETDGDTGASRPTRRPYRTELGRQVAEFSKPETN